MTRARYVMLLLSLFLFSQPVIPVHAGPPTDQVKQTIDKVIDILKNKDLKKPANERKRRVEIRSAVSDRFDFEEMSKRALALHWRKRTPEERKEFVSLFTDLLEKAYVRKIERYSDEKVLFTREQIDGHYSVVDTTVVSKGTEIPIEYRLLMENGKWMVYDVVIEGVSLINNYRTQFNQIIRNDSYAALVRKLKSKEGVGGSEKK